MKYREIIADNLSKAGWSWGCVSTVDCNGRTMFLDASCAAVYVIPLSYIKRLRRKSLAQERTSAQYPISYSRKIAKFGFL